MTILKSPENWEKIRQQCWNYAINFVKTDRCYNKDTQKQARAKYAEFLIYYNLKDIYTDMISPDLSLNSWDNGDLGQKYSIKLCQNNKNMFFINENTEIDCLLFLVSFNDINKKYYLNEITTLNDIKDKLFEPNYNMYKSKNKKAYFSHPVF